MKKYPQKFRIMLSVLVFAATGFFILKFDLMKEKLVHFYLDQGESCNYGYGSSDSDISLPNKETCTILQKPSTISQSSDVDSADIVSLVNQLVQQDFPEFVHRPKGMLRFDANGPSYKIKAAEVGQMAKEVWLCNDPAMQPLTTKTRVLALCAFVPTVVDSGYGSVIHIYEFRQGLFGVFSRRLLREVAYSNSERDLSVLFSLSFGVLNQKLLATIEKHQIHEDRQVKKYSSLWVYGDKAFRLLLDFESFSDEAGTGTCRGGALNQAGAVYRWLPSNPDFIKDGASLFFSEARGDDANVGIPLKQIPFIFDAKNWTLNRKFPRKPGETF